MKFSSRQSVVMPVIVLALAGILIVLAVLQYRWSQEVSEAASARLKATLQSSMFGVRQDLYRELAGVALSLQPETPTGPRDGWSAYVRQYESWQRSSAHPGLIANVFLWEDVRGRQPRLLHLNPALHRFEPDSWPFRFDPLPQHLEAFSADLPLPDRHTRHADRNLPPVGDRFADHQRRTWAVDQNIPALVHLVLSDPPARAEQPDAPSLNWLVVELDLNVLRNQVFPELAERYFSGSDGLEYSVAITTGDDQQRLLYASHPDFAQAQLAGADATLNLMGPMLLVSGKENLNPSGPAGGGPRAGMAIFVPGPRPEAPAGRRDAREAGFAGLPRLEPMRYGPQEQYWQLLVKHRKGSLDAVVAALRRRNLAIGFGVLAVLAVTMAMVILASQRAQRLARLQMDFVAGVSHELRTPLSVISAAGDNIADGVIGSREQLVQYGAVIKKQARQLSDLIEQILMFAAGGQNRRYTLRPVRVPELIEEALGHTAEVIQNAGCVVEQQVDPGLPPVLGDLAALSQCLQNLITNAAKYGGDERWIGIRAAASEDRREVRISVSDRGMGIERAELAHIFEPFYRSPSVTSAQIHGTGLGLPLAQQTAEAMGGRITVRSEAGRGSTFTLHLCAADATAEAKNLAQEAGSLS